ncbi:Spt20 family [Penicillium concentricum]|uniref:Spt20 family n=1 Tax=Penicillium concentricum TaxID=293559 RepID=A0A9W9VHC3_9EURO|nr:Spt20 family [Penicillium concentricum]KAJ5382238.1 Spt20 family [Penicillium concentricum]
MMATAISKPASHTQKMKRPPPPFGQAAVNGVKGQHLSSSPTSAAKRLPTGASVNASSNFTNGVAHVASSTTRGPLNRTRNQSQRPMDQSSRSGRPVTRTAATDNAQRVGKKAPEPYVKTTSYILKKYSKCPPSLIVHLHPTHFRFEQQDGSFPYNSEMKVIIEHIRAGTVPHDLIEELLRGGVQFYEGCLIVRVIDHKSASAQARKVSATSSNENNTPFSLHNYNEHVTPSAFVPYPKQNQDTSATQGTKVDGTPTASQQTDGPAIGDHTDSKTSNTSQKNSPVKPRVFTTVLHPTARTLQAELTLLVTTPDPRANKAPAQSSSSGSSATPGSSQPDRGHVAKRQKMLVEPEDLLECESKMIQALAPPLFLDPVHTIEAAQELFKHLESPLHCDPPPLPKRRKRTVAELAADEALAAEEERFMLIMDERLEPTASGPGGAAKAAAVDDAGGVAPFEPRFSRFKTLETIRMQHEEKAKREHEMKLKQELAKRQQQEQERERRRAIEQRQAEEHAKEESRRQQLAAQQAQAQLAAQQQNRHIMAQPNGVSQGQQSSPVVRNQTPHTTSSPLVGNIMPQAVPMTMTASGSGSPPRPPSALQHAHPNVMSHPMAPSRSQQGPSRHSTPQMTQGTPAMSHATPIMRNVTPTQRMGHGSPTHSMGQTPVMNQGMAPTPQMNGGMPFTPQQQMMLQQHRQQALLQAQQQGHMQHNQFTPQQLAQLQANAHAQQNIQSHQQQMLQQQQQQQQQQNHQGVPKITQQGQQAYQAQLMRAQYAQMQIVKQQQQGQHPQMQGQQPQPHQGNQQMTSQQQQQMLMAAAQANGGQMGQNGQPMNQAQRYTQLYQQRLLRMRHDMSTRYMAQYGPPNQYPSNIAQQYGPGLEKTAKAWVAEVMRRERDGGQQQQQQRAALQAQQMQAQGSMHSMGGMNQ